jgi:hypothetical protein
MFGIGFDLYGDDYEINWGDFLGPAPANRHNMEAYTKTNFEITDGYEIQKIDGLYRPVSWQISISMDRYNSWSVSRDIALLKHEQGHYDITVIGARELRDKLYKTSDHSEKKIVPKVKDLFTRILHKINEAQKRYDDRTKHGTNNGPQQHWNALIYDTLSNDKGKLESLR